MVHGFGADSRSWLPFVAPLMARHRFIMPDLRGFGGSHHVPIRGDCVLTQFAQDLEDVLEALHGSAETATPLPVAGISMGALTTVQSFHLFGGKRFSRYLHIDQGPVIRNRGAHAHGLLGPAQEAFFARLERLLDTLAEGHMHSPYDRLPRALRMEFWSLFGEFAIAAFTSRTMRSLLQSASRSETVMRRILPVTHWPVYLDIIRAYLQRDYDLREVFRTVQVPLTVLIGGDSKMYPPAGQRVIAEYAPHARVHELPGVGHNVPWEAPRAFMQELRDFVSAA
ncbi:MAG: alpha/beta hydrolase [Myxococcaceae bacterium]|nr:alpha/beta hydrolase [Myxococcaceae bacterium]